MRIILKDTGLIYKNRTQIYVITRHKHLSSLMATCDWGEIISLYHIGVVCFLLFYCTMLSHGIVTQGSCILEINSNIWFGLLAFALYALHIRVLFITPHFYPLCFMHIEICNCLSISQKPRDTSQSWKQLYQTNRAWIKKKHWSF